MNTQTQQRCEQFIENKTRIKHIFPWEGSLTHISCASIYTGKNKLVDQPILNSCKQLLKQKVSAFSNFRGLAGPSIASMLAISNNPESTLDNGLMVYKLLKEDFLGSTFLPLAAMMIAQLSQSSDYEMIVTRTKTLYRQMKSEHPFLTSSEDSAFCALMALSDKNNDTLISHGEQCYQMLKGNFFSADSIQSLSHVLALCDGNPHIKCENTMNLYHKLKKAGIKYGTSYELPTLGILAMSTSNPDEIVREISEIDHWLSTQKGFGVLGSISKKQRLMYAGILSQQNNIGDNTMQTATINGTLSLLIAQEVAMCAAIAASSAAAAASASSSS